MLSKKQKSLIAKNYPEHELQFNPDGSISARERTGYWEMEFMHSYWVDTTDGPYTLLLSKEQVDKLVEKVAPVKKGAIYGTIYAGVRNRQIVTCQSSSKAELETVFPAYVQEQMGISIERFRLVADPE